MFWDKGRFSLFYLLAPIPFAIPQIASSWQNGISGLVVGTSKIQYTSD